MIRFGYRYEIRVLSDKEIKLCSVSDSDIAERVAKGVAETNASKAVLVYSGEELARAIYPTIH